MVEYDCNATCKALGNVPTASAEWECSPTAESRPRESG